MVSAIMGELALRKAELPGTIASIYFGGGTPSLLTEGQLTDILKAVYDNYKVASDVEITLEANPDDLSLSKLRGLKHARINRLSIGIQTFDDQRLKMINRAHSSAEARTCLDHARLVGFDNISADLIYALPPNEMVYWEKDLETLLKFDPEHISLYGLTIEPKTVFGKWKEKGKFGEVPEDTAASQYQMAIDILTMNGYEHYEVSNFAKSGFYSRHNSSYWDDQPYLGIGPGAHSYNGSKRSFNVSNNFKYMDAIARQELPLTTETLSETDKINEYIFTHLRTRKGIDLEVFQEKFGKNLQEDHNQVLNGFVNQRMVEFVEKSMKLTSKGFMIADEITWRIFYDE